VSEANGRLVFLRLLLKVMAFVVLIAFVRILLGSLPERDSEPELSVSHFDVSAMKPGDHKLIEWSNKPLFIVYRKEVWESALTAAKSELYRDPQSARSTQPDNAVGALRTPHVGWFVSLGLGTGAGCALTFEAPEVAPADERMPAGGFIDPCDNSRYDLAGRVYAKQAAKRNTVVPEWRLEGEQILVTE